MLCRHGLLAVLLCLTEEESGGKDREDGAGDHAPKDTRKIRYCPFKNEARPARRVPFQPQALTLTMRSLSSTHFFSFHRQSSQGRLFCTT